MHKDPGIKQTKTVKIAVEDHRRLLEAADLTRLPVHVLVTRLVDCGLDALVEQVTQPLRLRLEA